MRSRGLNLTLCLGVLMAAAFPTAAWSLEFGHTWGGPGLEFGNAVEVDPAGNVYLAGTAVLADSGGMASFVAKFDRAGALLWDRVIMGSGAAESSILIDTTLDTAGNLHAVGRMENASAGMEWSFALGLSPDGTVLYASEIVGIAGPIRVAADPSTGGTVVVGEQAGAGYGEGVVYALDATGGVRWAREALGAVEPGFASPWAVTVDASGNAYVFIDRHFDDVGIAKFDRDGAVPVQRILASPDITEYTWDVVLLPDGDLVFLGTDWGNGDLLLAKMDASLNPIWTEYAGSPSIYEDAYRLVLRPDGLIWAIGLGFGPIGPSTIQYRFLADGSIQNASFFPAVDLAGNVAVADAAGTGDGGYVMAGTSYGVPPRESIPIHDEVARPSNASWVEDAVRWGPLSLQPTSGNLAVEDPLVPVDDFRKSAREQAWFAIVGTAPSALSVDATATVSDTQTLFTSSVSGGSPPYAYRWSFGDATFSDEASPVHAYGGPGRYLAQLVVQDAAGNLGYKVLDILISGPPAIYEFAYYPVPAGVNRPTFFRAAAEDLDGGPLMYLWDFGDNTSARTLEPYVDHVYTVVGSYVATLTVTDDENESSSASVDVVVIELPNEPPIACFDWYPRDPSVGAPVFFNPDCSFDPDGRIVAVSWDFGDGNTSTDRYPVHVYGAVGSYLVTLTVTDDAGANGSASARLVVTENAPPVAVFSWYPPSPQPYETVYFSAFGSYDPDGYIVAWMWDFGDGTVVRTPYPEAYHAYAEGGDYLVTLTIVDNRGATGNQSQPLHVNLPPVAQFAASAAVAKVGTPVTFDATSSYDADGFITGYLWDFGDGSWAEGPVVSHVYAAAGSYVVRVWVTDERNATGTAATAIAVLEPKPPVAIIAWSPSRPGVGQEVTFDGSFSLDPDGSIATWIWQFGDGGVALGSVVTHTYANAGTYTVKLTVIDEDGLVDEDAYAVPVASMPRAEFRHSPESPAARQVVAFTAAGSYDEAGIVAYAWDFGDGGFASGWQASHAFAQPGTYRVTLTVTNAYGVTASASRDIAVTAPVTGRIVSFALTPVAGATVSFYSGGGLVAEAVTGADGAFELAPLPAGTYDIEVSRDGFRTVRVTVTLTGKGEDLGVWVLEPKEEPEPFAVPIEVIAAGIAAGALGVAIVVARRSHARGGRPSRGRG